MTPEEFNDLARRRSEMLDSHEKDCDRLRCDCCICFCGFAEYRLADLKDDIYDAAPELFDAIRQAWAERDEARVAYVEASKQRNAAESRHAFCDENKKDLRAHRDRLEKELEVAVALHFAAASVRPEDWDNVVTKLQEERDARPDAATVAKVVALLKTVEHDESFLCCESSIGGLCYENKTVREALRLLEKP